MKSTPFFIGSSLYKIASLISSLLVEERVHNFGYRQYLCGATYNVKLSCLKSNYGRVF